MSIVEYRGDQLSKSDGRRRNSFFLFLQSNPRADAAVNENSPHRGKDSVVKSISLALGPLCAHVALPAIRGLQCRAQATVCTQLPSSATCTLVVSWQCTRLKNRLRAICAEG